MSEYLRPARVELKDANEFVGRFHRHHKPVTGHRFSVGVQKNGRLVGVAIVGRPVARLTPQTTVAEVTRCCTDGTKNACSFLYSSAARIAQELGFHMIQTFILESEHGASLRASGWEYDGDSDGGSWNRPNRERRDDAPVVRKQRWIKRFNTSTPGPSAGERTGTMTLKPGDKVEVRP